MPTASVRLTGEILAKSDRCMTDLPLKAEVWPRVCHVAEVSQTDINTNKIQRGMLRARPAPMM